MSHLGWIGYVLLKESPSDGGGVKGASLSTEKRDISLGGSYLVI